MDRILITGVAGFIGSHVAARFVQEGFEVIGVDDLSNGKLENVPLGVTFIAGDLSDKKVVEGLPECSRILHLAGQSSGEISFDNPQLDLQKNTVSTLNLIEYGIKVNAKKLVYASSMSVYGHVADEPISEMASPVPLSCYGVSKLCSEGYLRIYKDRLPFVALRMFNVYGPGQDLHNMRQGMVSIYLAQALEKRQILVKGGTSRFRDFVYIDDVVEAWYRSAISDIENVILNVGTGIRVTVEMLLAQICSNFEGVKVDVTDPTPGDQTGIFADNKKISEAIDISDFTPLSKGLTYFIEWAKENYNRQS